MCMCILSHFSHLQLFVIPWTLAHHAPLSMEFSRQEYWSWLPCPPPGDHPDPGIDMYKAKSLEDPTLDLCGEVTLITESFHFLCVMSPEYWKRLISIFAAVRKWHVDGLLLTQLMSIFWALWARGVHLSIHLFVQRIEWLSASWIDALLGAGHVIEKQNHHPCGLVYNWLWKQKADGDQCLEKHRGKQ